MTGGRRQGLVLLLLVALCVLRGLFWAVASPAPSPIDEMQHFDYVRSIAHGEGVPTVGKDRIGDEVLRFAKSSRTFIFRSFPYPSDPESPTWRGADPQYEGIQGPTYYALMAPFYWLGRPFGVGGAFYMIRFGSVLLGALALPLSWLLARRLLPRRPNAWLLPATALTFVNAVTAGPATIGNDVVVLTGAALAALVLLQGLERRTAAGAIGAGLVAGFVLLGKTTAVAMVPVLGLLAWSHLRRWWADGEDERRALRRWVVAYGAAFVAPFAVWTGWNLLTYHAVSGAAESKKLTGALQAVYPRSLHTLWLHVTSSHRGLWQGQLADVRPGYNRIWEVALVVLVAGALLLAWRRRDGEAAWAIGWGTATYPLTFLAVAGSFVVLLGETGVLLGRYLWVAVVPLAIALGVAAFVVGGARFGVLLVLAIASVATWRERADEQVFLHRYYEGDVPGGDLAPAVDQSWNDGYVHATAIRIDVPSAIGVVDLGLERPPDTLVVANGDRHVTATLESATLASFARYRLAEPLDGPVTIPVATPVAASATERERAVSLEGAAGDPLVRAHCPTANPNATRFAQVFEGHPPVGRGLLRLWPTVNAVGATAAALAALAWGLRRHVSAPG